MIRNEQSLKQLLDAVQDWVRAVAHPNEDRVADLGEVPQDIVQDMAKRGFFLANQASTVFFGSLTVEERQRGTAATFSPLPRVKTSTYRPQNDLPEAAIVGDASLIFKQTLCSRRSRSAHVDRVDGHWSSRAL